MSDASILNELAERCERAAGPDREIDREISVAIGRPENWHGSQLPNYTASIDSAMQLVPEGMVWLLTNTSILGKKAILERGTAYVGYPENAEGKPSEAATPALALCAASLRARVGEIE